jgi:hypothetical protein
VFKGNKKGNDGADEVATRSLFKGTDVAEEVRETILNPSCAALAADCRFISLLQQTGLVAGQRRRWHFECTSQRHERAPMRSHDPPDFDARDRSAVHAALVGDVVERPATRFS